MGHQINNVFSASVTSVVNVATAVNPKGGLLALLNTTAAVAYLQIFNLPAASVTLGTTVPTASIGLPASGGIALGLEDWHINGTGFSVAGTTTRNGSTTAAIVTNIWF